MHPIKLAIKTSDLMFCLVALLTNANVYFRDSLSCNSFTLLQYHWSNLSHAIDGPRPGMSGMLQKQKNPFQEFLLLGESSDTVGEWLHVILFQAFDKVLAHFRLNEGRCQWNSSDMQ